MPTADAQQKAPGESGVTSTGPRAFPIHSCKEEDSMPTLDDTPDNNEDNLATYMAEVHPTIRAGTPLYDLYARDYDYSVTETKGEVIKALYPDRQVPVWSDPDEAREFAVPGDSMWRSIPAVIRLRKERGRRATDDFVTLAQLKVTILQGVSAREPILDLTRAAYDPDDKAFVEWHACRLSIGEATELAHLLLLLVDVATDTADEIAGDVR